MHTTVLLALLLGCDIDAVTDPPRDEAPPLSKNALPLDPTPHQLEGEPVPFMEAESLSLLAAFNEGVVDAAAAPLAGPFSIAKIETSADKVSFALAPSGDRFVIMRDLPTVLSAQTGEILAELPRAPDCSGPSWSGNGAAIAMWCPPERSAGEATRPPRELRIWEPDTGRTRTVSQVSGSLFPSWVEPVGAWWVTQSGAQNLASLVSPEGEVRNVPLGEGLTASARRKLFWSHDGRHGFLLTMPREAPYSLHIAPLSWVDGQLSLGEAREIDGDRALALQVLPDGRALVNTPTGPLRVLGPDGAPQWASPEHLPDFVQAVAARTGRCPPPPPRLAAHTPHVASSDGPWITPRAGVQPPLDRRRPPVPFKRPHKTWYSDRDSWTRVWEQTELRAGRWLVTLHGDLYLLDAEKGRATWALKGGRVLASHGSSALVTTDGASVTSLDFETREARTTAVQSVATAVDGAWLVQADGTLQRVRGDGTVTHQGFVDPPRDPLRDPPRDPPLHLARRYEWSIHVLKGRLLVTFGGPQPLAYRLNAEWPWFGWDDPGPGFCGTGLYIPSSIGWADEHSLHVLDAQGHEHVLRYDEAQVTHYTDGRGREQISHPQPMTDTLTDVFVDDASYRFVRASVNGTGMHEFIAMDWEVPHCVHELPEELDQPAPAPFLDLHTLRGDGWVLFRPDGSASGRDRRASVLRQEGDSKAQVSPLYVPNQAWASPPPVELEPCPWDQ